MSIADLCSEWMSSLTLSKERTAGHSRLKQVTNLHLIDLINCHFLLGKTLGGSWYWYVTMIRQLSINRLTMDLTLKKNYA